MTTWVILLAGGVGKRMGGETPKQFLVIEGKPVACHSFDLFREMGLPVVVVAHPDMRPLFDKSARFAMPGKERQDSVWNGLQELPSECDLILVHDAARPCVRRDRIEAVLAAAEEDGAAVLGRPSTNTVKEVENGRVVRTLDRARLWEVSTPQVLKKEWLRSGLLQARQQNLILTDDVSAAELLGHPTRMVEDHPSNRKLTVLQDLPLISESLSHATI